MKALIVYSLIVVLGAVLSGFIGLWVESNYGPAMSLLVFLTLFLGNFVVGWVLTILIIDGTLRDKPVVAVAAKS